MDSTAIIRKGEKQYVALCPELEVASQGFTIEEALKNLREAIELYIEDRGMPKETSNETIIAMLEVNHETAKTAQIVR